MLTIAVLLIGGLMTVSEAPEILTLTDNVTNDCESVQIAQHGARKSIVENATGKTIPAQVLFSISDEDREISAQNFLRSPSAKSPRSLLLLLVSQRK